MDAEKKSSRDWMDEMKIVVMDPDGWNRQDFDNSWNEMITREEFMNRVMKSTVMLTPQ